MMKAPERLYNVSTNQLSIARHYGYINFDGHLYHYDAASDQLVRSDIWWNEVKERSAAEREKWIKEEAAIDEEKKRQGSIEF